MKCKVCGNSMVAAFRAKILCRHDVQYNYCERCGFLQTEEPYWLAEAYESAVAAADTGLVQRNITISRTLSSIIYFLLDPKGTYLDVAGGYGMLTRLMRDIGFDFYWSDKYSENLLARGFEAPPSMQYTAITAFEVLEHVEDPISFVADALRQGAARTLVLSTQLFQGEPPIPGSWWYYAFETGQHISFFQQRTLRAMAEKLQLKCYSVGSIHLMTDRQINAQLFRLLASGSIGGRLSVIPRLRLESRTMTDHLTLIELGAKK